MSTTLTPIITTAGINVVFNADNNGLKATIKEIALGDTGWTPDNAATALKTEKRRVPILGGERISSEQIHLTAVEDGTDLEYWVREVGFYLEDGTLLAIWSKANQSLAYKSASIDLLLAFDLLLSALPADSVTIDGSAGFSMPPASNARRGTIRIATQAEVDTGTAEDIAVNPAQLAASTSNSTLMNKVLAQDGESSGLDADLVRGLPANFSRSLSSNGYQQLPGGLIMQWGMQKFYNTGAINSVVERTVTFPIAFPTACLHVNVSGGEMMGTGEAHEHIYAATEFLNISVRIYAERWRGNSLGTHDEFSCRWLALGY